MIRQHGQTCRRFDVHTSGEEKEMKMCSDRRCFHVSGMAAVDGALPVVVVLRSEGKFWLSHPVGESHKPSRAGFQEVYCCHSPAF